MRNHASCDRLAAAVVVVVADALALADLHARLGVVSRCGTHALLDLAGHSQESLLDVAGVLRGGLKEGDSEAVSELLRWLSVTGGEAKAAACWSWHMTREPQAAMMVFLTFATVYSTTFLSVISLLLPTSSLLTPSVA